MTGLSAMLQKLGPARSTRALSGFLEPTSTTMREVAARVAQKLGDNDGPVPPPQKVREIREVVVRHWAAKASLEGMDSRLKRRIPVVLFVPAEDPMAWPAADKAFCNAFIRWMLEKRRTGAALATVRAFLRTYPRHIPTFDALREGLRDVTNVREVARPGTTLSTIGALGHLEEDGPRRIASQLLGSTQPSSQAFAAVALDGGLEVSMFSFAVFEELAHSLRKREPGNEARFISRFVSLVETEDGSLRFSAPAFRAAVASALLEPFAHREPEEKTRDIAKKFCMRHLGDPRARDPRWTSVSPAARDVMVRWLVQESFDAFFRIIDKTAEDRMWSYRRPFWERYLQRGYVVEAWAVLGRAAAEDARALRLRRDSHGVMRAGDKYQSALLMRIRGPRGSAIVAEWSHNGSCRIWSDRGGYAPRFYQHDYHPDDLRAASDIDFAHHGSEHGTWQGKIGAELMRRCGTA